MVKNPPSNAGDVGSIPGSGRFPGGGHGNPSQVFLPGESHGQRSLAGYSPWGCKESDMIERLNNNNQHDFRAGMLLQLKLSLFIVNRAQRPRRAVWGLISEKC